MTESPEDYELFHYGVKGMRWGQRKRALDKPNEAYTESQRYKDRRDYGKGYVKKVNREVNKGKDLKKARGVVKRRETRKTIAIGTGVAGAYIGAFYAPQILDAIGNVSYSAARKINDNQRKKAGEKAVADLMAEERGLHSFPTIELSFNDSNNRWE